MNLDTKSTNQEQEFSELDELTEELLGFAALSEGLGFQKTKLESISTTASAVREDMLATKAKQGTGAIAAGPAMPAGSIASLANLHKQAATNVAQTQLAAKIQIQKNEPKLGVFGSALQEPAAPQTTRSVAFILDLLFATLPLMLAMKLNFSNAELYMLWQTQAASFIGFYGFFVASYFLLSESFGGQSLGKMLFQLRIVEDDKYQKPIGLKIASMRIISMALGVGFAGLGLISSLWDSKARPFHDKVTSSIVRKKK